MDREANLSLVAVRCSTVQHVLGNQRNRKLECFNVGMSCVSMILTKYLIFTCSYFQTSVLLAISMLTKKVTTTRSAFMY